MERCYHLLQRVVSAFELRLFKHIVSNKLKNWSPKQYDDDDDDDDDYSDDDDDDYSDDDDDGNSYEMMMYTDCHQYLLSGKLSRTTSNQPTNKYHTSQISSISTTFIATDRQ